MKIRLFTALIFVLAGGFMLALPVSVQAKDVFAPVCNSGSGTGNSAVCTDKNKTTPQQDPFSGPNGLLANITKIVSYIAGAAAIIMIIVSALRFITSGSDVSTSSRTDTDVENARRGLASALIGLAVIVLARTLILFLLNRL